MISSPDLPSPTPQMPVSTAAADEEQQRITRELRDRRRKRLGRGELVIDPDAGPAVTPGTTGLAVE